MINNKNELVCYNSDDSGIVGEFLNVIYPLSVEDVKKAVLNSKNVVPRGMGSNIVGGCIPKRSDIIDMKFMNKINFDFKNKLVSVEAGASILELNEKLKSIGYEFPIFGEGTIGGMIALNIPSFMGGFGNIKEWIEEVNFVNGRGELIKFGKSGLSEICGLEGITGIITSAVLRVIPFEEKSASIFQSDDIEEVYLICKRLRLEMNIVMLRLYSPYFSKVLGFPEKYHVIVGFRNEYGKIKGTDYKKLYKKLKKDYYWLRTDGFRESEDPKLIFERIEEFLKYLDMKNIPYSGDLKLGIIYPFFRDVLKKNEVIKMIDRMNGKLGKYGVGIKRRDRIDSLQKKIIHRIKLRHDPFLKINKGKFIEIEHNEKEGENNIKGKYKEGKIDKIFDRDNNEIRTDSFEVGNVKVRDNLDRDDSEYSVNKNLINKIIFNKDDINSDSVENKDQEDKDDKS